MKYLFIFILFAFTFVNANNNSEYVGSSKCMECHIKEHNQWKKSDHFKAMAIANKSTVLGNFNNKEVKFHGINSRLYEKNNVFYIDTENENAEQETYKILYTFGYFPLQQYLVETKKGHLQVLNIAWDSRKKSDGGQKWFHIQENEKIDKDHLFYWTKHFQNWNNRCAECHSTNLRKNYNLQENSYNTEWSEINVSCEACHGSGFEHVKAANDAKINKNKFEEKNYLSKVVKSGNWTFKDNNNTATLENFDIEGNKQKTLNTCGACHSRRVSLSNTQHGKDFNEQFKLKRLTENLYHVDGQIQGEVFVMASFMQSKMYEKGVSCLNCHNAHTGKVITTNNSLCLQCHKDTKYDNKTHHFHEKTNSGSKCINCHMPESRYMGVDDRRDHSFSIPRPDLSIKFGTPNACVKCHADKDNQWANENLLLNLDNNVKKTTEMHKEKWIEAHYKSRRLDILSTLEIQNIMNNENLTAIHKSTLLEQLNPFPTKITTKLAMQYLNDKDPILRASSIYAMQLLPPRIIIDPLLKLLKDDSLLVRTELAMVLSSLLQYIPENKIKEVNELIFEYESTLKYNLDSPAGQSALATLYSNLGKFELVKKSYLNALKIEPQYIPALLNLADIYRAEGKEEQSRRLLKQAIIVGPDSPIAQHTYGLYLVRKKQYDLALKHLKIAASLKNTHPRYIYVYAIALNTINKPKEAILYLKKEVEKWPNQYELLSLLIDLMNQNSMIKDAGKYISEISRIAPKSPQVKNFINLFQNSK